MLAQDLFESSPGSSGQSTLKQLQAIAASGQDGNVTIGIDMMPIQSWQATYLMGIYKALNQRYGVERALSMIGNYDFVDRALERQEQKLSSMSSVSSVPGERGVTEGGDVFAPGIENTPEYKAGFETGKLPVPHPEGSQQYAAYYKGVIDKATPNLNKAGATTSPLKEIGNTPAGQAALTAVQNRAYGKMDAWAANPKSGYSSTPSAVAKASQASVAASNRQYGFGPDKSKVNTVMARDALRQQQAQRGIVEEVKLPYPEGSENLGRANMELLIKAYNEPTSARTTVFFGDKAVDLDRKDVEAIADYYDDQLPDNAARWNFIRTVMNSYDNFQNVLHKIGRRSAAAVKQPGLFQEASKKKEDDDELGAVRDVALQRAIAKAKADFPTAGSGLEALAKDFMQSQEQDRRDFDQLQTARRRHDQLLGQISKVDQEQQQEIQDLEDQNSTMSQRLQQLQRVNAELEKKLAAMTGRRDQRTTGSKTSAAGASTSASTSTPASQDVVVRRPPKARTKKDTKPKQIKIQPSAPAIGAAPKQLSGPETPRLPASDTDNILPPMFRRTIDPELMRGRETATDIEFREPVQMRATAESSKSSRREADYGADYQDMVRRVGQLAKQGPRKTVWDAERRVYRTVPINQPRSDKPVKEATHAPNMRPEFAAIKSVSDWAERLRTMKELQRDSKLMTDPEARTAIKQRIDDLLDFGIKQGYMK